eukprot:jgi/Mesvir1/26059/Mv11189-RA.1
MAVIKPQEAPEDEPMAVDDVSDEEEDDDLRSESDGEGLLLGFIQDAPECTNGINFLDRFHFPSKVGGAPAWLDPVHLPPKPASLCGICSKPLTFLLQVYAPVDTVESAFHRTVFLFACADGRCWQQQRQRGGPAACAAAFRCQLARLNSFYSYEAPAEDGRVDTSLSAGKDVTPCSWCRTWKGDLACGRCKRPAYCSKAHQVAHWKAGHSKQCTAPAEAPNPATQTVRPANDTQAAAASSSAPMDTDTPMVDSHPSANHSALETDAVVGPQGSSQPHAPSGGGPYAASPSPAPALPPSTALPPSPALPPSTARAAGATGAAGSAAGTAGGGGDGASGFLLREYELVVEAIEDAERDARERDGDGAGTGSGGNGGGCEGQQQRLLREYEARRAAEGAEGDYSAEELRDIKVSREESHWASVQAELDKAPGQVLRYSRMEGSHPLWMKESERPPGDITRCAHCGSERVFEFQVLPQLLFYLKVDNEGVPAAGQAGASSAAESSAVPMDWGTIIVYTCKETCQPKWDDASSSAYVQEYVWAQSAVG